VFGLAFFAGLMPWLWYFGAIAIVPLVAVCSLYVAGAGALIAAFGGRGIRSPWLTASVWVVFESLRGRWPEGGMPWGEVGSALHDFPVARSLASWGGVALVTFVVVAWNDLLVDLLVGAGVGRDRTRRPRAMAWSATGLVGLLVVVAVGYGTRYEPTETAELRVAMVQGNDKNRDLTLEEIESRYLTETHLALADTLEGPYDLIILPESGLQDDPESDAALRARIVDLAQQHDADVLVNALVPTGDGRDYNTNFLYEPDGELQATYIKQHLVPFGEYVPLRDWLGFIDALDQIPTDFKPGDERVLFDVKGTPVGSIICFESAFGPLVSDYVRDGAEMIVVTTNNRSYRRSGNAEQHLAMSQMRAAETGRPVLHASISGVTAIIDAGGDVHDTTELFVNEVVTGTVAATTGETPFVRFGEWVLAGSLLVLLVAAVAGEVRRRRGPSAARDGS